LAFELLMHHFARLFYGHTFTENAAAGFSGVVRVKLFLLEDIGKAKPARLAPDLDKAIKRAARRIRKFGNWGDMHRLRLAHPLANLPIIGRRYRFGHYPVGGSSDTVMKTAHRATDKRHSADYGANARHVSDLSDLDENYFVLLGGQDGWFRSSTFTSQLPLWLEGGYVQVPLRLETVRRTFKHQTNLRPKRRE
jgi:penicillin amidase